MVFSKKNHLPTDCSAIEFSGPDGWRNASSLDHLSCCKRQCSRDAILCRSAIDNVLWMCWRTWRLFCVFFYIAQHAYFRRWGRIQREKLEETAIISAVGGPSMRAFTKLMIWRRILLLLLILLSPWENMACLIHTPATSCATYASLPSPWPLPATPRPSSATRRPSPLPPWSSPRYRHCHAPQPSPPPSCCEANAANAVAIVMRAPRRHYIGQNYTAARLSTPPRPTVLHAA